MTLIKSIIVTACFCSLTCQGALALDRPTLAEVNSFAFAIGLNEEELNNQLESLARHDLIIVDGEIASAELISNLQHQGSLVLGYLSVGTIEKGRFWYRRVRKFRLELWEDWGEWYANVNSQRYRKIIKGWVARRFMDKGFDGLFLDNVDMVEGYPAQMPGMRKLVKLLSRGVHRQSAYLFVQNGDESIKCFASYIDGWNREDVTSTYNFNKKAYQKVSTGDQSSALETLARLKASGIFVTTTDYTADADSAIISEALEISCAAGAVPFVSDIYLTRVPLAPFSCAS